MSTDPEGLGLPPWLTSKRICLQCRRHKRCGLYPWEGKISWRRKCNPLQCSCLENPKDRGAWQAIVHSVLKSQIQLSAHTHTYTHTHAHTHTHTHTHTLRGWLSCHQPLYRGQDPGSFWKGRKVVPPPHLPEGLACSYLCGFCRININQIAFFLLSLLQPNT